MNSLLPKDKLSLKRLELAIKRISISGILLVGVDTLSLANEFESYLIGTHSLKLLDIESEILSTIAYDETIDKNDFFLVNIFNKEKQQDMINHLQFQRDFIPEKNIRIVVILSNEMLEYLKINAGDLFSTVKFSYTFTDHSFNFKLVEKDDKLNKAIKEYEDYLKLETQHNDILLNLTFNIANQAEKISEYELSLEYYKIALKYVNNKIIKADLLSEIGIVYNKLSNNQISLKYQNRALKIYKHLKNKIGIANTFTRIGNIYITFGKFKVCMKYQKDALQIFREIKNKSGIANSLGDIGMIYRNLGDLETALNYQKDSLSIYEEIGNKSEIGRSLLNIGNIYHNLGDLETALNYQKNSLSIYEEIGNKFGIASILSNIGSIYRNLGDLETALNYQKNSLSIFEEIGNKSGIASVLSNIGIIYKDLGDLETALNYQKNSLSIYEEIGNKSRIANSLLNIGNIYRNLGNLETALEYQKDSLKIDKEIKDKPGIAFSLHNIGVTYLKLKDYKRALNYLNDSLKIAKENKFMPIEAKVFIGFAELHKELGNQKEAKKNYLLSKHLYEAMGLTKEVEDIDKELLALASVK